MKKILFVIDKTELKYFEFNKLVTNFWLIKELLEKKCEVYITINSYLWLDGTTAIANCHEAFTEKDNIFYKSNILQKEVNGFDLVMFRSDPPVNIDYINATYVLDFAKDTKIINSPNAIRNFNEKLHSLLFYEYMSPSLVTASMKEIEHFLHINKQIVLKPLNQCFGSGVMYLYDGDPNTHTIINTLTNNETTIVMVQKYISAVKNGDIRIMTLGDNIIKYGIRKLPNSDDFKFNEHNDNFIAKTELSEQEINYYTPIAKKLNELGIVMAGLDVIDDKIIEINVTSPCYFIKEANSLYNVNLEKEICNYLYNNMLTPSLSSV